MDSDVKAKIKAKLGVCSQAVAGLIQEGIDPEERAGWISIYNGAMRKILNEYLADEPAPEVTPEAPEDVDGTQPAPEVSEAAPAE